MDMDTLSSESPSVSITQKETEDSNFPSTSSANLLSHGEIELSPTDKNTWFHIPKCMPLHRWNFVDSTENDLSEMSGAWAVTIEGHVFFRASAPRCQSTRNDWKKIELPLDADDDESLQQNVKAMQVAVSAVQTPFVVRKAGDILYKIGAKCTALSSIDCEWQIAKGPPGRILQLSAGKNSLWVLSQVDMEKKCWFCSINDNHANTNKDNSQEFIWKEIVDPRIDCISVSADDLTVLALDSETNAVFHRTADVTETHLQGSEWRQLEEGNKKSDKGLGKGILKFLSSDSVLQLDSEDEDDEDFDQNQISDSSDTDSENDSDEADLDNSPLRLDQPTVKSKELSTLQKFDSSEKDLSALGLCCDSSHFTVVDINELNDSISEEINADAIPTDLASDGFPNLIWPTSKTKEVTPEILPTPTLKICQQLSQGFLPGCNLEIGFIIPKKAQLIIFCLSGSEGELFQFKINIAEKSVVQNCLSSSGKWGVEDRANNNEAFHSSTSTDRSYMLKISCEASQFITTVTTDGKTFSYLSRHEISLDSINLLTITGDVSVIGIRYDSSQSSGQKANVVNKQYVEYRINPALGFFGGVKSVMTFSRNDEFDVVLESPSKILPFSSLISVAFAEDMDHIKSSVQRHPLYLFLTNEVRNRKNDTPCQIPNALLNLLANSARDYVANVKKKKKGSKYTQFLINVDLWIVLSQVQCENPVSTKLLTEFPKLFSYIVEYQKKKKKSLTMDNPNIRAFWISCNKLVDCFTEFIQNILWEGLTESEVNSRIEFMCLFFNKLIEYLPPVSKSYIEDSVRHAIFTGAVERCTDIFQINYSEEVDVLRKLNSLKQIGGYLVTDLNKSFSWSTTLFKMLGINSFAITYRVYDFKYGKHVESLVTKLDDLLAFKELHGPTLNALLEIYKRVKSIAELSRHLPCSEDLTILKSFHKWFHPCVALWFQLCWQRLMGNIPPIIKNDVLESLDNNFSSCARDTLECFYANYIDYIWKQLCWPDGEEEFEFFRLILQHFNKCIDYFEEVRWKEFDQLNFTESPRPVMTMEELVNAIQGLCDNLCLAVCNLEYMRNRTFEITTNPIISWQAIENMLLKIAEQNPIIAEACRNTVIEDINDSKNRIEDKIKIILTKLEEKLKVSLPRVVEQTASSNDWTLLSGFIHHLMEFEAKMSEASFRKVKEFIFKITSSALEETIWKINEPPAVYQLIEMNWIPLQRLVCDAVEISAEDTNQVLKLHGSTTLDLIFKYLSERLGHQSQLKEHPSVMTEHQNGFINFKTDYCKHTGILQVEILNCRRLKDSERSSSRFNPYVRVELLPRSLFNDKSHSQRTSKKINTSCPIFDEKISIRLREKEMSKGGYISFSVYYAGGCCDCGRGDFLGEAIESFKSVPRRSLGDPPKQKYTGQVQLPLTLPNENEKTRVIMKILSERKTWDSQAAQFINEVESKTKKDYKTDSSWISTFLKPYINL